MTGTDAYIGSQVLTFAIPLGTFCFVLLVGFFARKRNL